jgi:hypothetical protein
MVHHTPRDVHCLIYLCLTFVFVCSCCGFVALCVRKTIIYFFDFFIKGSKRQENKINDVISKHLLHLHSSRKGEKLMLKLTFNRASCYQPIHFLLYGISLSLMVIFKSHFFFFNQRGGKQSAIHQKFIQIKRETCKEGGTRPKPQLRDTYSKTR